MRKAVLFLVAVLFWLIYPVLSQEVFAGDLGALVKIDRLAPSKTTGGTICVIPESNDTENSIQVIFPSGFTVNSTASNWTVTTTNLPSGSTPLPGIDTASDISGQIVTFPSDDLATGTQYCFNFASTNTLTTHSTIGTHLGTLRTRNASNSIIDTRDYAISIVNNDQISVTASVAAKPTDFSALLAITDPPNGTFSENTKLTYILTYGSLLSYQSDIIVEAQWGLGTIQGNLIPTINDIDYLIGSASNGYNNTPPVVDSVNKKIDWTISAVPGNTTNQTVNFKLKTKDIYTGSLPITFTVSGRVYGLETVTPDSTVTSISLNSRYITPTPAPTCVPGSCPTSTPGPTSTPTPTVPPKKLTRPTITDIQIRTVSSTEAAIFVQSTSSTNIKIAYGTSTNSLTQLVSDTNFATEHIINLKNLKPTSRYYFRVTAYDYALNATASDLYLLDTAQLSNPPRLLDDSLILTSGDVVLTDPLRLKARIPAITIPINTPYAFKFAVSDFDNVKSVKAILRNNNVLGLSSSDLFVNSDSLQVIEISPGQYIGKLRSNEQIGNYRLVLQIQDFSGNIAEQTMSILYVVEPLEIVNSTNNTGIENAKVTFYYYNRRLKIFELLSSNITPIKNPNFSETDGKVWTILPEGKYQVEVKALGYETKTVDFEINSGTSSFPTVNLNPLPFNIATYFQYSMSTAYDVAELLKTYLHTLRTSIRFFELMAITVMALFVFLSAYSLARRLSVPLRLLPYFALYHTLLLFRKPNHSFVIHGRVTVSIGGEVLPDALIYIGYPSGRIITHTTTNGYGEFLTNIREASDIRIIVTKKGFKSCTTHIKKSELNDKISIEIVQIQKPSKLDFQGIIWYFFFILDSLFEAIFLITLLVELLFILEFGIWKVIPFIIISMLNIILWAVNVRAKRS